MGRKTKLHVTVCGNVTGYLHLKIPVFVYTYALRQDPWGKNVQKNAYIFAYRTKMSDFLWRNALHGRRTATRQKKAHAGEGYSELT